MPNSPLYGRRIHISGSIHKDLAIASTEHVEDAREFIRLLVIQLLKAGATFVVPVDKNPIREADNLPICFDWLILETIKQNLHQRPQSIRGDSRPLIIAVQHYKNEDQIPQQYHELWDALKGNTSLVSVENAGQWDMNSMRLQMQATHGDVLICLGGEEGVQYLANLYHEVGKPVIPLKMAIGNRSKGTAKLWESAFVRNQTEHFFQVEDGKSSHQMLNTINFRTEMSVDKRVGLLIDLLQSLRKPVVFGVRLLDPNHKDFLNVDNFFTSVVKPVVESFGYELKVIDGSNNNYPLINQDIFNNLHRASVVVADITGERPNCFIELGYALARGIPTMICAMNGSQTPFDIKPVSTHFWNTDTTVLNQRHAFQEHWLSNAQRRKLVEVNPLIP